MGKAQLRIFLGSPSADTLAAREQVAAVVREVCADPKYAHAADLTLCRWDDPARPVICSASGNPQLDVIEQTGDPAECDLFIGLLCHTMGGTLPESRFGRSPADRPWHCTEWELDQARAGLRRGRIREIWVWRDATPLVIDTRLPVIEQQRLADQNLALGRYLESFKSADGTIEKGLNSFSDPDDFARQLRHGLRTWIDRVAGTDPPAAAATREVLTPAQQQLLDALLTSAADVHATPAPEQIKAVLAEPVQGLRGYLLRRYAQWSTLAGGRLDRQFVNLTLMIDRGLDFDGQRFAPDEGRREQGRYDDLAELLAEQADVSAWVLVGDPGSGKSTLLQHHELVTARSALGALAAADGSAPHPEVCIWQRLSEYSAGGPPPARWLAERWVAQQPGMPSLEDLSSKVRLRFLLDGLNEIKAPSREAQLEAVAQWAQWAAQQSGQALAPVFSVRTLDQSPMSSGGMEVRQITLAPWTPGQMQAYCTEVLGEGNALWPAIDADAAQLDLCRLPFNLAHQCELFRHLQRPARDRAELLSGLFWLRLRTEFGRGTLQAPGLLSTEDRERLAGERWKQALLALPQQGCLVRWLDASAERMHRDGREVSLPRPDLLQRVQELCDAAKAAGSIGAEPSAWLRAVQDLGLLGEGDTDAYTGEPNLRFTHQLWQEFFAARGLRGMPSRPAAGWPELHAPPLVPLDKVLDTLGRQEALPGPDPTHWEEAVKMAVQLERDPAPWLAALRTVNLPLAGRAAAAVLKGLEATPRGREAVEGLRSALLLRSRDPAADLRHRIEAADALGPLGDPRYESGTGPEGQRYLWPRRRGWVRVAGGRYVIGSDAGAQPDEGPPTPVDLAAFEMAFAPVTNAEFACFIDAGGYDDERWWVGETAQAWRREGLRNDDRIEWWGNLFADLRRDADSVIARYPNLTEAEIERWRDYATWSEEHSRDALEQTFGARRYIEPQEWRNPMFNQPLQPVVGICLFEARAYVRWLAVQTGRPLALPTEAQWEAAARGRRGRAWPWGEAEPGRWQINADPAHLRRTSPVGVFVAGDTPEGIADLAGNVWEWTDSRYTDKLDAARLSEAAVDDSARRAVRGGSWGGRTGFCRAGCRGWNDPGGRSNNLGLRVVCCPILEP